MNPGPHDYWFQMVVGVALSVVSAVINVAHVPSDCGEQVIRGPVEWLKYALVVWQLATDACDGLSMNNCLNRNSLLFSTGGGAVTEVRSRAVYNIARSVFDCTKPVASKLRLGFICYPHLLGYYSKFFLRYRSYPSLLLMSSPAQGEYGDPFADRPRQTHFQEPPQRTYDSATNSPFESTTNLPREFGAAGYADEDYVEKLPLTGGESYNAGGYYPPG